MHEVKIDMLIPKAAFLVLLLGVVLGVPVLAGELLVARCYTRAAGVGKKLKY